MEITIIGTGNMARGIATRALAGGHSVTLLGTDADKAQALADTLSGDVSAGEVGDPLAGDVVVLAIWYAAVDDVLGRYGDQLDGKVVVDITNPIDVDAFEPLDLEAGSAAQEIAAKAPGAKVVKAFNTTFAGTLSQGQVGGQPLDVLIASDAEDAKETVSRIVTDGGLRPIDAGPLKRAREIEAVGYLHMVIQQPLGTGFSTTVKILSYGTEEEAAVDRGRGYAAASTPLRGCVARNRSISATTRSGSSSHGRCPASGMRRR
jgi:predicted dinucleotide-binding enzyme